MPSVSALGGLIPQLLRRRLALDGVRALEFSQRRVPAAVLFADVAGFTHLAETFAARGLDGIDGFSALVNTWFGRMVDVIATHGGDLIRFAGDAPIVVFTPTGADETWQATIDRAKACALDLQRALHALHAANHDVVMRIGIGAGDLTTLIAGGVDGRWEFVVGGDPLRQVAEAERAAKPDEIMLSLEARAATPPASTMETGTPQVEEIDDRLIRPFVSRSLLRFVDAGQAAWTAELRRVSVLFAGLDGIDLDAPDGSAHLHNAFRTLQSAIFDRSGSVVQFLFDDKGLTLVAAWGLPGRTHEDDAARAVRTAAAAVEALEKDGVTCRVGVATGRVYCGWRGNERRREYALIGATVNLAARLMTVADGVLCDHATTHAASAACGFDPAGPFTFKGLDDAVRAFRPSARGRDVQPASTGEIIGRRPERQAFADALQALGEGRGSTLFIRAEAGMGKSTLVDSFAAAARAAGVTVATGTGESLATFEPYFAWRPIVASILGVDPRGGAGALNDRLRGRRGIEEYAPLVAEVLGVEMADNDVTSQMTQQARSEKARDLIVQILNDITAFSALAIVVDNLHWCDSLSLGLTLTVHRRVNRLLLVVATRPDERDALPELSELAASEATLGIHLGRLERADVRELILRRLNATHVPDELVDVIDERTGGYPLFVGELASALLEGGVIEIRGSACVLPAGGIGLRAQRLPDSVQGVIADRLDRLDSAEQLTMKVASVVGAPFDVRTVAEVHPIAPEGAAFEGMLQRLQERGLIRWASADRSMCEFGHAVVQDVAYSMIPGDQRRALHRATAEWYERTPERQPALLAHHWTRAEHESKSLHWLEQAGVDAARKGAVQETVRCFRLAMDIAARPGASAIDTGRRVRWMRYLGQGLADLGAAPESRAQLHTALDLLGHPLPRSRTGLALMLARESISQMARRAGVTRARERLAPSTRERLEEEARVLRHVTRLVFLEQDQLAYVTTALRSINLAERSGTLDTASAAYTALAYIVSMFGLERLGRHWWARAEASGNYEARLFRLHGGLLFSSSHARWDESARLADAQAELIDRVGNSTSQPLHLIIRFYLHLHRGEAAQARGIALTYLDWTMAQNNVQEAFSAHVHLLMAALDQGRVGDADRHIAAAAEIAPRAGVPMYSIMYHGLRLDRERRYGCLDRARDDADALRQLLTKIPPFIGGDVSPYAAYVEYWLAMWRRTEGSAERQEAMRHAKEAFSALKKHTLLNPYARPRRWLLEGKLAICEGRQSRAVRLWRRSAELADRYRMLREAAHAWATLGLHDGLPSAERREYLSRAREVFAKMGSTDQVDQIDRALTQSR